MSRLAERRLCGGVKASESGLDPCVNRLHKKADVCASMLEDQGDL